MSTAAGPPNHSRRSNRPWAIMTPAGAANPKESGMSESVTQVVDPVCGMTIDRENAVAVVYQGTTITSARWPARTSSGMSPSAGSRGSSTIRCRTRIEPARQTIRRRIAGSRPARRYTVTSAARERAAPLGALTHPPRIEAYARVTGFGAACPCHRGPCRDARSQAAGMSDSSLAQKPTLYCRSWIFMSSLGPDGPRRWRRSLRRTARVPAAGRSMA
jgi:hypothetical protein